MMKPRRSLTHALFVVAVTITILLGSSPSLRVQTSALRPTVVDEDLSAQVLDLIQPAMDDGDLPGAVVVMASMDKILFANAYGLRQQLPTAEPMTLDTVFDLASLTKPVATATSVMILVDDGLVSVQDTVDDSSAATTNDGATNADGQSVTKHQAIRVQHLLLHTSGLIPDNAMSDYAEGPASAWKKIEAIAPRTTPGQKFAYSDVGFMRLQQVVEKASGESLDEFAHRRIFQPLEMIDTHFRPAKSLHPRIAPTEKQSGRFLRGTVHDPRAAALGGVAGHAGLFSSANDLVKYGRMMLRRGQPILTEATWRTMLRPHDVGRGTRTLGWDHQSPYSGNRPDGFSETAIGHGGFTGTVLWIDPEQHLVFVFLSNRLHPDGKGKVNALAAKVGKTILAHHRSMKSQAD